MSQWPGKENKRAHRTMVAWYSYTTPSIEILDKQSTADTISFTMHSVHRALCLTRPHINSGLNGNNQSRKHCRWCRSAIWWIALKHLSLIRPLFCYTQNADCHTNDLTSRIDDTCMPYFYNGFKWNGIESSMLVDATWSDLMESSAMQCNVWWWLLDE